MRLRPLCVVVLMSLLVPTAARASDHVAGIFGAISALSGSTLRGGHGTLEVSLSNPQRVHDYFDLLVDSSVHAGEDDTGAAVTKITLMFGGRALYRTSNGNGRYILFAHGMFGTHRSHIGA